MRIAFALLMGVHGLIHVLGAAKAFRWADVAALGNAVSPLAGALWLIAAMLLVGAATGFALSREWWWWLGLSGLVLSQALIAQRWSDARFGTLLNLLLLVPVALSALDARPSSFRSRFARDRDALLARPARAPATVTEADLSILPTLMQTYLRRVGAVGRPHIRNMRVRFDAQMRSSAAASWMPSTATQYEFFDSPARLFHMKATRGGVPIDVFHRYVDDAATFQVKIAGVWPMVDKGGPVLTRAETVTLMNDIVVMAPAAVLDLPFTWTTRGAHTLSAKFTNAGHTVSAEITFDGAGDLVGFFSRDRPQDVDLGDRNVPWSTPISGYREIDGIRVGALGDANWVDPSGEWTYGRFVTRSIAYNVER
ncbi:MAG: hypothetical protein M3O36_16730 [Myxococcota bacterium]|nr:hypothetical protein [Myxococcota bacterium]